MKKVDFIWINREQKAFEWFLQLLSQLEMEQAEHFGDLDKFLNIHLYITSVMPVNDFSAVTLHLAMDLMHKKVKIDTIFKKFNFSIGCCNITDKARSHNRTKNENKVRQT